MESSDTLLRLSACSSVMEVKPFNSSHSTLLRLSACSSVREVRPLYFIRRHRTLANFGADHAFPAPAMAGEHYRAERNREGLANELLSPAMMLRWSDVGWNSQRILMTSRGGSDAVTSVAEPSLQSRDGVVPSASFACGDVLGG